MSDPYLDRFPRVEDVILTLVPRGEGKDHSDPCRTVVQVHHKDGTFIAEHDPLTHMEALRGRLGRAEQLLASWVAQVTPEGEAEIRKLALDYVSASSSTGSAPK